jgi:two-component system NtrC family sensor kinase
MAKKARDKSDENGPAPAGSAKRGGPAVETFLADEMYRSVFQNSAVAITVTDAEERIVHWNRFAEVLLGRSWDELYMKPVKSLYPSEEWKRIRSENVRQKGMQHHLETQMTKKDGDLIDVDLSLSVLKGPKGQILGSIGMISDITERKTAQSQLQIAEEKYRTIFENSASAITVTDENENIIAWNRTAEVLLGMDRDDLYQRPVRSLYPEVEWKRIRDQKVRDKGMQQHLETRITRKNGEIVDVDLSLSILKGPEGQLTGSIAIITDITEQKKAEDALRRSEQKLKHYLDSSPDAIFTMDRKGTLLYGNRAAERITGYNKEELLGQSILDINLLAPEYMEKTSEVLQRLEAGEPTGPDEAEVIRKDGSHIFMEMSTYPTGQGSRTEIIGVARDITERKRAEEEKRRMEQQLQLAGRLAAVGELAAGVAHELNNPLSAIQGFAQLLERNADIQGSIRQDMETILKEAQRASRITSNLLSFARRYKPEKKPISVNEALEKSLELHTYRMWVNNIELCPELDYDLPVTMADFHQLQQVFVNIINNAEQAMTEAHGRGKLILRTELVDDVIHVSFIDDGPGIQEENLGRIFDPFFTTKEAGKGTGLGLAICYGIIKEHGGRMYAMNNKNGGATLLVELPITTNEDSKQAEAACSDQVVQ